uniref:Odorant receptor n=1 Tax=Apis cerana cerana TaxID=94128 RepID=A0A0U2SDF7_APICC|nr:odorant receptor 139 [Apis cerana cerana]
MDVFDKHQSYHSYRTVMKIIGLWPYNNSIYVCIQRLWLLIFLLGQIIFQIVMLLRSEITLQNCTLISFTICPFIIIFLRYIGFMIFFPTVKFLFHHIQMEENIIQDSIEAQIRTKFINDSCHMIDILFWITYALIAFFSMLLLCPMILDFINPLNESRTRIIHYFTVFSYNRIIYIDILCLNYIFIAIIASLSIICIESMIGLYSYHASLFFKIIGYRIQKIVTYLTIFNLSSKQIDSKLVELYRIVDIHNQVIELINALNNSGIQFMVPSILIVISVAINLHQLVNTILIRKNQLEILIFLIFLVFQMMIMFICNYSGQILIDNSQELLYDLYISTWYFVPLKVQKILLLIMVRSSITYMISILGVFTPCHAGFSTVIYSNKYIII